MIAAGFVKKRVPWWLKLTLKICLSRIPVSWETWRALRVFQLGDMLVPEYALAVFSKHYFRVKSYLPAQFSLLELGPGDSLATALIGSIFGASQIYLLDIGPFASCDLQPYRKLCYFLESRGYSVKKFLECSSVSEMLIEANAMYLTDGLNSLRQIPENSIDVIFSQAVLEHVPLKSYGAMIDGLYRVQRPGGVASHRIDFKDHLGGQLNSLRLSDRLWESKLFSSSGFYTNRLRASQVVARFETPGYELITSEEERWQYLPISREKLSPAFNYLSEDDLLIKGMDLLVRKPQDGTYARVTAGERSN